MRCQTGAVNLWTVGCADPHKLHSTPQLDGINLIRGTIKPAAGYRPLGLSLPGSCPNNRDRRTFASADISYWMRFIEIIADGRFL
jgi:hypothetical protein